MQYHETGWLGCRPELFPHSVLYPNVDNDLGGHELAHRMSARIPITTQAVPHLVACCALVHGFQERDTIVGREHALSK
jgi:hypothetical protein